LNHLELDMRNDTTAWDPEKKEFPGILFFELWVYNKTTSSFQYHERFLSMRFNMTV